MCPFILTYVEENLLVANTEKVCIFTSLIIWGSVNESGLSQVSFIFQDDVFFLISFSEKYKVLLCGE
jgi:hypothetical protein